MTTNKPEQLARRVRAAAGPYNNQDMPVQQVVSAMAARMAELEAVLREARSVIATALTATAPDWFRTDADVGEHQTVKRIDVALAQQCKEVSQ